MGWRAVGVAAVGVGLGLLPGCTSVPIVPLAPGTLPAYVHNDYRRGDPPLGEALARGYSGVEADCFLVDGELLVAHDREDARADRTLRNLYLEPLRRAVADSGRIRPDGRPFILNIEAKEPGPAAFTALHELLLEYRKMLVRVEDGREIPGPVQVILVGAQPPLAELAALQVRCCSVQRYWRELPPEDTAIPAHLLRLVSVQYPQHFTWDGTGDPPRDFEVHLAELVAARNRVPGRLLRVFKVPRNAAIYAGLLAGGVDLIGTKTPGPSAELLRPGLSGRREF